MRQLQTSTLTNQDISAFLLTATYTADADRAVMVSISADQVAGNGDYKAYITRQIAGAGSAYMVGPITTFTVPSGITAIAFTSVLIPVENTDVIKAYVSGLAGDTSTPDIITRFYELTYIRPTVNGRTLDIAATGEVGMDFTNRLDTTGILPSAAAGGAGGLPTVDASNYVAGVLALATDAVSAAALKADAVQYPREIGKATANAVADYLEGKTVPASIPVRVGLIDQATLKQAK